MKFVVNPKIFEQFSNPRIGIIIVNGVNNTGDAGKEVQDLTADITKKIRTNFQSDKLSQQPNIAAWREAHRLFGSKAKDYLSSIEALYKRILRGEDLNPINPLVDLYNYISLKYMLPAGGEDLDAMRGDLQLTYAHNETPVTVLGKPDAQIPPDGEVIYKDDVGTICRRWNWREVERTILTTKTQNSVLVLEAIGPVTNKVLTSAMDELKELVQKHCGGKLRNYVVDSAKASVELI